MEGGGGGMQFFFFNKEKKHEIHKSFIGSMNI